MGKLFILFLFSCLFACNFFIVEKERKKESKWQVIFSGENLNGWVKAVGSNGNARFIVKNKTIIGITAKPKVKNSFLRTYKKYKNFELKFDVKIDNPLNSGVQIRSKSEKNIVNYRLFGPQVEIDALSGLSGYLYGEFMKNGEKRGYWLTSKKQRLKHKFLKKNEWNSYHIKAIGKTVEISINGHLITKTTHKQIPLEGIIALQVHSINRGGPYQVIWKNIRIKEL